MPEGISLKQKDKSDMSVSKDQLIQFIERPGLLKDQTIADLKE